MWPVYTSIQRSEFCKDLNSGLDSLFLFRHIMCATTAIECRTLHVIFISIVDHWYYVGRTVLSYYEMTGNVHSLSLSFNHFWRGIRTNVWFFFSWDRKTEDMFVQLFLAIERFETIHVLTTETPVREVLKNRKNIYSIKPALKSFWKYTKKNFSFCDEAAHWSLYWIAAFTLKGCYHYILSYVLYYVYFNYEIIFLILVLYYIFLFVW